MNCKHEPITVYENGGTVIVCALCGVVIRKWKANKEAGQAWTAVMFSAGVGAVWAGVAWMLLHVISFKLATFGALAVGIIVFVICLFTLAACATAKDKREDEVE